MTKRKIFYLAVACATLWIFGFVAHHSWISWRNHQVRVWVASYGGAVEYSPLDSHGNPTTWNPRTPNWVYRSYGPLFDEITLIIMTGSPALTVSEIRSLASLRKLHTLYMGVSSFSDDHAAILARNRSIRTLFLDKTEVSDAGLAVLAREMGQLESLDLTGNPLLTGNGLRHLSALENLSKLSLMDFPFSNSDLSALRPIRKLENLGVGTEITNEGIREIVHLKTLKEVGFFGSEITDEGLSELAEGLPRLERIQIYSGNISQKQISKLEAAGIRVEFK